MKKDDFSPFLSKDVHTSFLVVITVIPVLYGTIDIVILTI